MFCRLFSGLAKKTVSSFFLCILTKVPQSGFNYADGIGNKSSFITAELHQLAVYEEQ
jgi:hypothetical protein